MAEKKRRLLFTTTIKDCDVETFRGSGPGGQHRNKTSSAVRITHRASGAVGMCQEHRSQYMNKKVAWGRMGNSKEFRTWVRVEAARVQGQKTTEEVVQESMVESNIKTEIHDENGRWKVAEAKDLKSEET